MTKMKIVLTGAVILALVGTFPSCKRDKKIDFQNDEANYGADNAKLDQTFNDVQNIADEASDGNLASFKSTGGPVALGGCATVTRDTISVPRTITIDFGTNNCLCNDGRYRRGQILVTYTGRYRDSGHVHTITFNNYFVNDNQVMGTKSVTNMGHNSNGQSYFSIAVNGSVIRANNAGTLTFTSNRTRTWTAGENTPARIDDEYQVTGSGTVTRPNNKNFSVNITSPLLLAVNCHWIKQGTVQITPANNVVRTLDYGNGTCDNQATLTVNGNTHNITLP